MESHQWRTQQQSDRQDEHSAKIPKLQLGDQQQPPASALHLFAAERKTTTHTSPLFSSPISAPTAVPKAGGYFSLAQWQELELQALIYKYMISGASVPMELILPIKRSLLDATPYYHHHHHYQHFQQPMLQTGYWGRYVVDPEPGRCRRTDGKKWRCSREVVTGQKYCERHVHRGRNRSRKHVEIPTATAINGLKTTLPLPSAKTTETHFSLSDSSTALDILPLIQRPPDAKTVDGSLLESYCGSCFSPEFHDDKPDGHVLRRFFDDWPRSQQELITDTSNNARPAASTTHLSISNPGNLSSDFSLKLSTGNDDKPGPGSNRDNGYGRVQPPPPNWSSWGNHGEASMGGPLAEALRSSTSTPSPTSVLQKPNGSISETRWCFAWK
ncbi:growth-regulating factor 3 [Phoenix dactylifera]|uniref:Growth-regulating factor n=1 Tax=Phoenix dactylifera TaxID=42345 RepID=A0A8B9AR36_PHODC|nr:growth-regulating factor 3 [Phoenix dactylifera]